MRLRAWLPPLAELQADSAIAFELLDARRQVRGRGEAPLSRLPKGVDCELVLHALDVVLIEVRLPPLSAGRLAAALAGLVEERLAGEVERNHIVASPRDAEGGAVAAIVERASLRRALEMFRRAGLPVMAATPQPLALPIEPGIWRVRVREAHGSVRTGPYNGTGFAAGSELPVELQLLLRQSPAPPAVVELDSDRDLGAWGEYTQVALRPAAPAVAAPPIVLDLLQYEFAPGLLRWQAWRGALALGGALVLTALVGLNLHAWALHAQERAIRSRMAAIVQETFPQVPVVLDPMAQMQRLVGDLRTGAGTGGRQILALTTALGQAATPDSVQSLECRDLSCTVRFRAGYTQSATERAALAQRAARSGLILEFSDETARIARKGLQ